VPLCVVRAVTSSPGAMRLHRYSTLASAFMPSVTRTSGSSYLPLSIGICDDALSLARCLIAARLLLTVWMLGPRPFVIGTLGTKLGTISPASSVSDL